MHAKKVRSVSGFNSQTIVDPSGSVMISTKKTRPPHKDALETTTNKSMAGRWTSAVGHIAHAKRTGPKKSTNDTGIIQMSAKLSASQAQCSARMFAQKRRASVTSVGSCNHRCSVAFRNEYAQGAAKAEATAITKKPIAAATRCFHQATGAYRLWLITP